MTNSKLRSSRSRGVAEALHPRNRRGAVQGVLLFVVASSLVGGFALRPAPAGACTCDPSPDLSEMAESAGAAFIGQPERLSRTFRTPFGEAELWSFAVERVFRGPAVPVIGVGGAAEGDSCHVDLGDYGRIGVVAHWRSGHLSVGQCGIFEADMMQEALGPGTDPVAEAELAAVEGEGGDEAAAADIAPARRGASARFVVALVAATAAAVGYGVARRRRRRRELAGAE